MDGASDEELLRRSIEETKANWESAEYYGDAEPHMDAQWRDIIEPALRSCDFRRVLELAPGHGRNTAKLVGLAEELHLVDVNASCIERCRERFSSYPGPCRLHYHVNDGSSLAEFEDASITLVYCWDAMVHFDRRLVRAYLGEIRRILVPGGRAALHLSNYGSLGADPESPWRENPHWRSTMSQALLHEYCAEVGLAIVDEQLLEWDGIADLDCAALLERTA